MALQVQLKLSPDQYLEYERNADHKHEYLNGEIFAMVGATESHNLIVANLIRELGNQLKKQPCKVYPTDMRVKVSPTGLYTYPDVVVVCGAAQFEDNRKDTLLNPLLIIEVLSDSTEAYDRGLKFEHYRRIESLAEYVLIAQNRCHLESYRRQPDNQWLLTETSDFESCFRLTSVNCELVMAEVYDKVE
jgi:Uma2 family endonuclease